MAIVKKNKKDKIYIDLDGPDGNAFQLMKYVSEFSKSFGVDGNKIIDQMKSGDYYNLLRIFDLHFGHFVTLQTENPEILDAFKKE